LLSRQSARIPQTHVSHEQTQPGAPKKMIDFESLRISLNLVRAAIRDRKAAVDLDRVRELDRDYIALLREVKEFPAKRNRVSVNITINLDENNIATALALRQQLTIMKSQISDKKMVFYTAYEQVSNAPPQDKLVGHYNDENQIVRQWAERRCTQTTARRLRVAAGWRSLSRTSRTRIRPYMLRK